MRSRKKEAAAGERGGLECLWPEVAGGGELATRGAEIGWIPSVESLCGEEILPTGNGI
jgi:hypothetical protein